MATQNLTQNTNVYITKSLKNLIHVFTVKYYRKLNF